MLGVGVGITSVRSRWSPESLAPSLWIRADSVTLASGDVAGWASRTGSLSFTQGTAGARPLYSATGGPNGKPYVELGGARWLQGSGVASDWSFLHTGALSVWAVLQKVGTTADVTAILATQATAAHRGTLLATDNSASNYRLGHAVYRGDGTTNPVAYATSSNNAAPSNTWRATEWFFNPAVGVLVQSAASVVSFPVGAYTAPAGAPTNAAQLGRAPTYTFGSPIRLCELIAVARVTSIAENIAVREYLRAEYGVVA